MINDLFKKWLTKDKTLKAPRLKYLFRGKEGHLFKRNCKSFAKTSTKKRVIKTNKPITRETRDNQCRECALSEDNRDPSFTLRPKEVPATVLETDVVDDFIRYIQ